VNNAGKGKKNYISAGMKFYEITPPKHVRYITWHIEGTPHME
jgi:hypothetical protein